MVVGLQNSIHCFKCDYMSVKLIHVQTVITLESPQIYIKFSLIFRQMNYCKQPELIKISWRKENSY